MTQPLSYQFGEYRLDRSARELFRGGVPVLVPTRVFDCLVYLIEHRDRAIGRDELVAALWGRVDVSDAQLGQIVLRARRAVGDDGNDQRCIRTMPKYGYRWAIDTEVVNDREPSRGIEAPIEPTAPSPAAAIAPAVAEAPPPTQQYRARTRSWAPRIVAALILIALGTVLIVRLARPPRTATEAAVHAGFIVLPVDVAAGPEQDWVRLGGMDALAGRLRAAGLRVPPSESVLAALQAGRGSGGDADAVVRKATQAELVVHAKLASTPQGWHAELVALPTHGTQLEAVADGRDILPTLRRAADQLLMRTGHVVPDQGSTGNGLDETLQRADAAMLANQLDVARAVLLAAPDLVRSEPQLRYRLAQIDFRAGRLREVETALQSVLDDGAAAKDNLLRARALTGLGTVHLNMGRFADAEHDFSAAIDALTGWQRPLERGQALGGRGAARAAQWRYAEAADDLGRARIDLEQAGDTLGYARLDMVSGELELQRQRPAAARPMLQHAIATFERFDAVNERLHSLAMLIECERLDLDYAAALATSDRALELRSRVSDPQLRTQILVARAELLVDLGRHVEAGALLAEFDRAPPPLDPQSLADVDRVQSELAFATGDFTHAAERAAAALARTTAPNDAIARGWLVRLRERAMIAAGQRDEAQRAFDASLAAESEDGRAATGYRIAAAELAASKNDEAAAAKEFAAALARADADGVAAHVVVAASAYARWLLAHDRAADAQPIVGRLAAWADRDFRCALLQLELFHALGQTAPWSAALTRAEKLAGEREIPESLRHPPSA